jgi:hypothetical protein
MLLSQSPVGLGMPGTSRYEIEANGLIRSIKKTTFTTVCDGRPPPKYEDNPMKASPSRGSAITRKKTDTRLIIIAITPRRIRQDHKKLIEQ